LAIKKRKKTFYTLKLEQKVFRVMPKKEMVDTREKDQSSRVMIAAHVSNLAVKS